MGNANNNLSVNSEEKSEIRDPFMDKLQLIHEDFKRRTAESHKKYNSVRYTVDYDDMVKYYEERIEKWVTEGNQYYPNTMIAKREWSRKPDIAEMFPSSGTTCKTFQELRDYYLVTDIPDFIYDKELNYSFRFSGSNNFKNIITKFIEYWNIAHPQIKCSASHTYSNIYLDFKLR